MQSRVGLAQETAVDAEKLRVVGRHSAKDSDAVFADAVAAAELVLGDSSDAEQTGVSVLREPH